MLPKIIIPILCLLLSACISTPTHNISIVNDQTLQFSGKGAGMGMMLSSSLGPAGIAVGIAIDVGIAKEIAQTADTNHIAIEDILTQAIKKHTAGVEFSSTVVTIERFGFISWPGKGDLLAPQLHVSINRVDGENKSIRFPEDFREVSADKIMTAPLDEVKANAATINDLFHSAAETVANQL